MMTEGDLISYTACLILYISYIAHSPAEEVMGSKSLLIQWSRALNTKS